jgi:hypothetical protein
VEVSVETQSVGGEADLGWTPVPNAVFPLKPKLTGTTMVWTAEIELPKMRGLQAFRLVIKEYELLVTDQGAPKTSGAARASRIGWRLVYADVVRVGGLRF